MFNTQDQCPACGGPGGAIGALGTLVHYTCRDCGYAWVGPLVAEPETGEGE